MDVCGWTISRNSSTTGAAYDAPGSISYHSPVNGVNYSANATSVHPTFYLNANTILKYGSGTKDDPYRIDQQREKVFRKNQVPSPLDTNIRFRSAHNHDNGNKIAKREKAKRGQYNCEY